MSIWRHITNLLASSLYSLDPFLSPLVGACSSACGIHKIHSIAWSFFLRRHRASSNFVGCVPRLRPLPLQRIRGEFRRLRSYRHPDTKRHRKPSYRLLSGRSRSRRLPLFRRRLRIVSVIYFLEFPFVSILLFFLLLCPTYGFLFPYAPTPLCVFMYLTPPLPRLVVHLVA